MRQSAGWFADQLWNRLVPVLRQRTARPMLSDKAGRRLEVLVEELDAVRKTPHLEPVMYSTVPQLAPAGASLQRRLKGHDGWVASVCSITTAEGAVRIVSGSDDKTVRIWDAESGEEVAVLKGHDGMVWSVCSITTAEGAVRIVSGSWDTTVRIWSSSSDLQAAKAVCVLSGEAVVMSVHAANASHLFVAMGSAGSPFSYTLKAR
jgi:WD40 repeat protein